LKYLPSGDRIFVAMASLDSCTEMPLCRGNVIEELSIQQLQALLTDGSFTSRDLVECYFTRIERLNPRIKAIIEINPDALQIADELDADREDGKVRTVIHGIPFLVKDNIATKDRMQTTAGSRALEGTVVARDAEVVRRLREAGGVLMGKANLSEWASMRASYYAEGYSSRGGQNRNPYNLAEHAGGSSSGSASAVAANMCAFAIGTETDGSVMFPANRCAVVGVKPTVGLVSTMGVIPEAPSLDTVGTLSRSVADAAIVLDVIADERKSGVPSHSSCLAKKDALKGAKFGLPMERVWDKARTDADHKAEYAALQNLIKQIEAAGAKIVKADFPSAGEILPPDGWDWSYAEGRSGSKLSEGAVVNIEFYRSLSEYLSDLEDNQGFHSLEDVMEFNVKLTDTEGGVPGTHPAWPMGQDSLAASLKTKDVSEADYQEALGYIRQKSRDEGIDAALKLSDGELDGLLVPLQADGGVACSVAAKAGYPMIAIPVGVNADGVPFGLGVIQKAWKESALVRFGSAIEDLIQRKRVRPSFRNWNAENYPMIGYPPSSTYER
jgi:amidase